MTTTTIRVDGLTCQNCVKHLSQELAALPGVGEVAVDLVPHGTTVATLVSDAPLPGSAIAQAVDEAGYTLVSAS